MGETLEKYTWFRFMEKILLHTANNRAIKTTAKTDKKLFRENLKKDQSRKLNILQGGLETNGWLSLVKAPEAHRLEIYE